MRTHLVDSKTNKQVNHIRQFICKQTGQLIKPEDMGSYFNIGGDKVVVSKKEVTALKETLKEEAGNISLVGFLPMQKLKCFLNIRPSYYLYPDEQQVGGSSSFFHALIKQTKEKQQMAILRLQLRKGCQIVFGALLPAQDEYNGCHIIILPYAEDIKQNIPNQRLQHTQDVIQSAKLLVNSLQIGDFDCRNFQNPCIATVNNYIQAVALGEQNVEPVQDLLQPDLQGFKQKQDTIYLFHDAIKKGTTKPKSMFAQLLLGKKALPIQSQPDQQNKSLDTGKKQHKLEPQKNESLFVKHQSLLELLLDGDINVKIKEMREFLKEANLPLVGSWDQLRSRILNYLVSV